MHAQLVSRFSILYIQLGSPGSYINDHSFDLPVKVNSNQYLATHAVIQVFSYTERKLNIIILLYYIDRYFQGIRLSLKDRLRRLCDLMFADGHSRLYIVLLPAPVSLFAGRGLGTRLSRIETVGLGFSILWIKYFRGLLVNRKRHEKWIPRKSRL